MRELKILPSQFTAGKNEYREISGFACRVKNGLSGYRLFFNKEKEGYTGEFSIPLRHGQVWFKKFNKIFVQPNNVVYGDAKPIILEIYDQNEFMVNVSDENIFEANDYRLVTIDLSVNRASLTAMSIAGLNLTVFKLDGTASIGFGYDGKDEIPLTPLIYPDTISIKQEFTEFLVKNTVQAGKSMLVYVGLRED